MATHNKQIQNRLCLIRKLQILIAAVGATAMVAGCEFIEDKGTTETSTGTPVTTPPDFDVNHDADVPTTVPDGDNTTTPPPDISTLEEGLMINDGRLRGRDEQLAVEFVTLNRNKMKVGVDIRCNDGDWVDWQPRMTLPLSGRNAVNTVTVRYQDWDGGISPCYRQSFQHDDQGPTILFSKYPAASLEEGATGVLSVEVTESPGTVQSVTCQMNGITKPCFAGRNEVSITQMPAGEYEFGVSAVDDLGNSSQKSVKWTVVSTTRRLTQSIQVNDYRKVDILMVIDNSGSMEYEQKSMGSRTSNFLSVLRGLDYQIAVTTTDARNVTLGDGRFIPIVGSNGQTTLDTSTPENVAQDRLSKTLQRPETGGSQEQGIRAAYRVVQRYVNNDSPARHFFREGAQFAVVVISDEDESDDTSMNDPRNMIKMVHDTFGGQKRFGFHSIITKPGDNKCKETYGATYGDRYNLMSTLTGGIIGSVCESDYSKQVTGIAEGVRALLKTLTLQCEPLPAFPVEVKRDGVVITQTFKTDGVNLRFDQELAPGAYEVNYRCLR